MGGAMRKGAERRGEKRAGGRERMEGVGPPASPVLTHRTKRGSVNNNNMGHEKSLDNVKMCYDNLINYHNRTGNNCIYILE